MADKWKCPFCGSNSPIVPMKYGANNGYVVDKFGEKIMTYCCKAQEQNYKYAKSKANPYAPKEEQYDPDEAAKW